MNTLLIGCAVCGALGFALGYWRGVVKGRALGLLEAVGMTLDRSSATMKEIQAGVERAINHLEGK